ncbi:nucleoside diphosphate kinase B-like [Echinops telfairi]|uniref:Nucleoside diphosphate kinase B-like n=1 Tax=Echinops telfairi TaxID=9371 RepID=A0AC55CXY1_ECHTE|nr:nucleoside diphosphate kinase B-like [Echinops telfairi]
MGTLFVTIELESMQGGPVGDITRPGGPEVSEGLGETPEAAQDLKARSFFPGPERPTVAMGREALTVVKTGWVVLREIKPADSKPGTIRGDFIHFGSSIICGSDLVKSAEKESSL